MVYCLWWNYAIWSLQKPCPQWLCSACYLLRLFFHMSLSFSFLRPRAQLIEFRPINIPKVVCKCSSERFTCLLLFTRIREEGVRRAQVGCTPSLLKQTPSKLSVQRKKGTWRHQKCCFMRSQMPSKQAKLGADVKKHSIVCEIKPGISFYSVKD